MIKVYTNSIGSCDSVIIQNADGDVIFHGDTHITLPDLVFLLNQYVPTAMVELDDEQMNDQFIRNKLY